jgi:hypothetical protein
MRNLGPFAGMGHGMRQLEVENQLRDVVSRIIVQEGVRNDV